MCKNILLLEIGIEEIPSNYLLKISQIILKNFKNELKKNCFKYKTIKCFFTSRRIALQIYFINIKQPNYFFNIKGPSISNRENIFENKIIQYWIKKYNIKDIKNIFYKNKYVFYKKIIKGLHIKYLLSNMITNSLKNIISIPNFMFWHENIFKFIRPIRTIVLVLGKKNIKKKILNIKSDNIIQGHRFMCQKKIILENSEEYEKLLFEKGKIVVDYIKRKNIIFNKIKKITNKLHAVIKINEIFLEELSSMLEWPIALIGKFNKKFLTLPSEILSYVMIKYQKYIPLYDKKNNLLCNFIILINIKTDNNEKIINNHEEVIKSRFKDIQFFFQNDLKIKFEQYLNKLKNIIFQENLGNLFEKTIRIEKISQYISKKIIQNINIIDCIRASKLSKCDLATQMVYEFPDLKGIIGMYYAKYNKENKNVTQAIKDQYQYKKNNFIPKNIVSCILFIADKIDTLVGMFSIQLIPTGDKDPFSLKNIILVIIRIIIEKKIEINLIKLINFSLFLYKKDFIDKEKILKQILIFIKKRCNNYYISLGYKKNIINSILDNKINNLLILDYKIKALDLFLKNEKKQINFLILTFKRINNILLKNKKYINKNNQINTYLLKNKEEIILFRYIIKLSKILKLKIKNNEYYNILLILSELYYPVNNFFKKVIINHKDNEFKKNRILILYHIKKYLLIVSNLIHLY
ncbi:glycine--tRNA ligase subunit beta [Enterobacteriaceae endosymbiont of Donacia bicoloricornis]|uniref:glycine--tRNA ligase subunit beta n=1 Tax=Enterobacteriaceae endosymbiont of Donacia bicoloricornis TaxID=2675772 RepID=UPI001448F1AF|nr:glycine--tRNA ligase subunit beta [Enterobacteriaceae endosymbiont of Donacia bicoloricornis]QJC37595.1 glycine--tRNA ligase subunit beta [Enterobacteriaceae endosymbiont of Donacia bicoloricornis]